MIYSVWCVYVQYNGSVRYSYVGVYVKCWWYSMSSLHYCLCTVLLVRYVVSLLLVFTYSVNGIICFSIYLLPFLETSAV